MKRPKPVKLKYTKRAWSLKEEKVLESLENMAMMIRLQRFPDIPENNEPQP